jgi:AbrB family looped-hinge helix DNA binding protein
MIYQLSLSPKGTVTIPKKIRKQLNLQRNVLLVQNEDGFILKAVPNILDLAGTLESDKKLSDAKIKSLRKKAFLNK